MAMMHGIVLISYKEARNIGYMESGRMLAATLIDTFLALVLALFEDLATGNTTYQ